ncbi:S8 family serine peptidase [Jannaschia aquimarina]|uniref:Epr protein n=1 Tax=Jannaschia aquimarina TaxID=935700 RepID=A0A0D1CJZ2_9RHOB|nr:S8 family serine peptidase [Jannaschia aquimarina]KIT15067.1 Minor extracellular protease Epr precursor [Jannaschia aquimarina]SNS63222.1 Subtilase family protein [Jannaschia aquimarina]
MRLFVILCLALAACTTAGGQAPRVAGPNGLPLAVVDARELIVLTAEAPETLISRAEGLGYTLRAVHPLPELDDTLVSLRIPDGRSIPEAIAEIEAAVPGVTAGANHVYRLQATDGGGGRDYAAAMIGWPPDGCRARASVGMIDAAITPGHPALRAGRIVQRAFTDGGTAPATSHGALVADLLIGEDRLRDTTLLSAAVVDPGLDGGGASGVVAILRAVDWLSAEGADVVNISLAGPYNKLLDRALGQAASQGMTFVAAVGNAGPRRPPQYPAAFPFALAVTAVDRDGAIYRNAIRGPHVDIAAPGVDILAAPGGRLTVSSGTSLAAPFVTATVASDPALARLAPARLRAELARRARDLGEAGRDDIFGAGLLRVGAAC